MKIRLKRGSSEIEVEGNRDDVDSLLGKWWTNRIADEDDDPEPEVRSAERKKRRGSSKPKGKPTEMSHKDNSEFNVTAFSNSIKERDDFKALEDHVLFKNDRFHKIAALLIAADGRYLTANEMSQTLLKLGVKASQSSIINGCNQNTGKLLHDDSDGARRYQLQSKERVSFTAWLTKVSGESE